MAPISGTNSNNKREINSENNNNNNMSDSSKKNGKYINGIKAEKENSEEGKKHGRFLSAVLSMRRSKVKPGTLSEPHRV